MNKFFINHLYDIFTVGQKRDVDVGVAFDMFRTDVRFGEAHGCNTGDALPEFDFKAAQRQWDKLSEADQKQAIEDYDAFVSEHYSEACAAFAAGRDAVDALVREVTA